jgi:predicted metal-dependent HD superfamily phosphohydrolase
VSVLRQVSRRPGVNVLRGKTLCPHVQHIQHCLREFDAARHLAEHPDCVETALWFHDAVYDSKAKDNEEKSAQLADVALAGVDASIFERVRALILIMQHKQPPVTPDEQLVVDCDLAILGQSEQAFDAYEQQIRQDTRGSPSPSSGTAARRC